MSTAPASARDAGVDIARGAAVLLMIQTHAYDGWVRADQKLTFAYAVTRVLGAIPAPLFLLLAGVGVALGEHAALARGVDASLVRARFVRRGLEVVAWGYLVSLVYALIDGSRDAGVILHADILHAIGLSIIVCAVIVVGRAGGVARAVGLAVVATVAQPILAGVWEPAPSSVPLAALLGLVVDVPGYTRFPLLPLVAFVAMGWIAGRVIVTARPSPRSGAIAFVGFAALAWLANVLTAAAVALWAGALTRRHPAVALNVIDGAARALAVLGLGWAIAPVLAKTSQHAASVLVRLGRGSLLAYAVHIPFCYGVFSRPISRKLDMPGASLALIALVIGTFVVVWARDAIRDRRRARPPRAPA